jgi:hypothetical protein
MNLHFFLRITALLAIALTLFGCGKSASFRYKLTLAVNTPEGVKRSTSVTEWGFWEVSIPARGTPHKLRGEALYLDLGPGKKPLIALLTSHLHAKPGGTIWDWPGDDLLSRLYGPHGRDDFLGGISRLAGMRGPRSIGPADLPDLVSFADVNDPKTVLEVDPNDLQATLGQGITWNAITLEMTDEPITTGIAKKLPWLPEYFQKNFRLDGSQLGGSKNIANKLSWPDFDQSGDLKRP